MAAQPKLGLLSERGLGRVAGQYRPYRGHSRDLVLGLALGLDGDSTGRAFDGVCQACGGLPSIVRSYLQSFRRISPSCFILVPFRPANCAQDSPFHTREICSQSKAVKTAAVGIRDFSGQHRLPLVLQETSPLRTGKTRWLRARGAGSLNAKEHLRFSHPRNRCLTDTGICSPSLIRRSNTLTGVEICVCKPERSKT